MITNEERDALNQHELRSNTINCKNLLVDVNFIKHLRLGRKLVNNELTVDLYNDIRKTINNEDFAKRTTDNVEYLIPSTKVIKDAPDDFRLLAGSPSHTGIDAIAKYIAKAKEGNTIVGNEGSMILTIALGDLKLTMDETDDFIDAMSKELNIVVRVVPRHIHEIDPDDVLKYTTIFVYDLVEFNKAFLDKLNNLAFINSYIFTYMLVPDAILNRDDFISHEDYFKSVLVNMTAAVELNYLTNSTIYT